MKYISFFFSLFFFNNAIAFDNLEKCEYISKKKFEEIEFVSMFEFFDKTNETDKLVNELLKSSHENLFCYTYNQKNGHQKYSIYLDTHKKIDNKFILLGTTNKIP